MFPHKIVVLVILQLFQLWLGEVDSVSQWDPFCMEETLYTPYVRIFQKGRRGAMLRDRGPGFIDVTGMQDIYVCTNGLVMLYYSKTRGNGNILKGEIYEHGELHWAPHHCELYNPSCTALGIDQPKKNLLSILLIGHPQDYRRPALQMFVAPTYDQVYKNYINLTSLIMIGTDGECLVEKGVERARLRVRINEPPTEPEAERPAWFCQLDSQRKLGQEGVINLNKQTEALFVKRPDSMFKDHTDPVRATKVETGSLILNRFRASGLPDGDPLKYTDATIAEAADRVYAALLNDRTMRFVGCLQYPDFSMEQELFMSKKNLILNGNDTATPTPILPADFELTKPKDVDDFWKDVLLPPWNFDPAGTSETRFATYAAGWADEDYKTAKAKVDTAVTNLQAEKDKGAAAAPDEIKKLENELKQARMIFSLWPLKTRYLTFHKYVQNPSLQFYSLYYINQGQPDITIVAVIFKGTNLTSYRYAKELEDKLKAEWAKFETNHYNGNKTVDPNDLSTWGPRDLANRSLEILRNLSSDRFETRFDPYNAELVKTYNENLNNSKFVARFLKTQSTWLGPLISNAETVFAQYNLYKELAKRSLTDFINAIKKMEKTKQPVDEVENTGDPFDSYFVDTIIDISNAFKLDGSEYSTDPGAQACYALAAPIGTCKTIKPTTSRACALCKNRKKQGIDWDSTTEWKQLVLDLIESIYKEICPYISEEFAIAVNRLMKGYLMASPMGTGLTTPINGSRLYKADHNYQGIVYNSTYQLMGNWGNASDIPPREPFWDQIVGSLEDCLVRAKPMRFWYNEDDNRPTYITLQKTFLNNKTDVFYEVEDLFMQEKADYEYSFNWAIDMNWRIFATVLGYCMPHYEKSIPLISAQFYAMYSKHFLHPLRQIWMSNRDNPVLKTILGSYYGTGKGDRWSKICMESSFVESGDRSYRPPRYLYVNAFTEMNYFTTGPLSGTSGRLVDAVV
ncbi:unnamed protein product [Orchesella dallaii]|uniref:Uncharacterized protein n=1 Tax=Orchesella dallaii TaxID=48710 RepID=A0ABP1RFV2_9HEXA